MAIGLGVSFLSGFETTEGAADDKLLEIRQDGQHSDTLWDKISTTWHTYCSKRGMNPNLNLNAELTPSEKPLVLIVDAEEQVRECLQRVLEATEKLSCITAASVKGALELLPQNKFALIVLDWSLDKHGAELLRAARKDRLHMPVVAIGRSNDDVRIDTDALLHQINAFMYKPLSGEAFKNQVMQILQPVELSSGLRVPQRPEDVLPLDQIKNLYIHHVVGLFDNNISKAAEALKIHRHTVAAALEQATSVGTMPAESPVAA